MDKKNIAIISLILAKVSGIAGVVLGFSSGITRLMGGGLLGLAAILLVNCFIFCLLEMKNSNAANEQEDTFQKNILKLQNILKLTKLELEGLQAKRDLAKFMSKM